MLLQLLTQCQLVLHQLAVRRAEGAASYLAVQAIHAGDVMRAAPVQTIMPASRPACSAIPPALLLCATCQHDKMPDIHMMYGI
jgi:hypothetical protein